MNTRTLWPSKIWNIASHCTVCVAKWSIAGHYIRDGGKRKINESPFMKEQHFETPTEQLGDVMWAKTTLYVARTRMIPWQVLRLPSTLSLEDNKILLPKFLSVANLKWFSYMQKRRKSRVLLCIYAIIMTNSYRRLWVERDRSWVRPRNRPQIEARLLLLFPTRSFNTKV